VSENETCPHYGGKRSACEECVEDDPIGVGVEMEAELAETEHALAAALDALEAADTYMREVAHVVEAAGAATRELFHPDGAGDSDAYDAAMEALRAALADLPVPPVEPTRATLQENGRSLEWPR
jgi:hypothetical protein